ncbi:hypothetical protein L1987_73670 [Smallanthus sonchifolius]|uniref:Uncharacterized protein n=1 Tax=Smallanthus sonchifolius TaxID=185202 RepID=A0ACB9A023_9ASTR|nr:hypothetical protein L1987_73670 [Smallanthus sonchifolius]
MIDGQMDRSLDDDYSQSPPFSDGDEPDDSEVSYVKWINNEVMDEDLKFDLFDDDIVIVERGRRRLVNAVPVKDSVAVGNFL